MAVTTEAPNLVLRDADFHQVRGWFDCSSPRQMRALSRKVAMDNYAGWLISRLQTQGVRQAASEALVEFTYPPLL
jgi:hypothetical protein